MGILPLGVGIGPLGLINIPINCSRGSRRELTEAGGSLRKLKMFPPALFPTF